jgi:hypothetical protein
MISETKQSLSPSHRPSIRGFGTMGVGRSAGLSRRDASLEGVVACRSPPIYGFALCHGAMGSYSAIYVSIGHDNETIGARVSARLTRMLSLRRTLQHSAPSSPHVTQKKSSAHGNLFNLITICQGPFNCKTSTTPHQAGLQTFQRCCGQ